MSASMEIQTLTLDAEEITRLAEKQVAARKRSRDSLIGDEEEEEEGFQVSSVNALIRKKHSHGEHVQWAGNPSRGKRAGTEGTNRTQAV